MICNYRIQLLSRRKKRVIITWGWNKVFNIGPWELLLILAVALIVFGPGRLPEVARSLGKAVNEFRKASSSVQRVWDEVTREASQVQTGETLRQAARPGEEGGKDENVPLNSTALERVSKDDAGGLQEVVQHREEKV
ncbi:MAG: twin-arginine translocase TatA/TatE family subunit [Bacillota bacterium]|jgi:sec-independent protein translocase protein TatA|nr:twin-arginine translocase TatA/TatE family subunit [Bacillota bacterium]